MKKQRGFFAPSAFEVYATIALCVVGSWAGIEILLWAVRGLWHLIRGCA